MIAKMQFDNVEDALLVFHDVLYAGRYFSRMARILVSKALWWHIHG